MKRIYLSIILSVLFVSCGGVKTAHFDQKASDQIIKTSQMVNSFYSELSQVEPQNRKYAAFKNKYIPISSEFYTLKVINGAREHNQEFIEISDILISEWDKYEARHKKKDNYPDILIKTHRKRLNSILMSMLKAETKRKEL